MIDALPTDSAPAMRPSRLIRLADALEWPVAFLALLIVPALVLEEKASDPRLREIAYVTNWIVWVAFCAEFAVRWAADRRLRFVRDAWFDLALILVSPPFLVPSALQGTRSLRLVRALRLLRLLRAGAVATIGLRVSGHLFGRRKFHYTMLVGAAIVFVGALAMFVVESGQNKQIASFGDALWWSMVTATTVGYGDLSPVTGEGRVIAVILMLTGIGVIGIFTATIASMFLEDHHHETRGSVSARLDAIEAKLDRLLAQQGVQNGRRS
jgi:voltage-gated potassium channel